jgi:hypothetical protein
MLARLLKAVSICPGTRKCQNVCTSCSIIEKGGAIFNDSNKYAPYINFTKKEESCKDSLNYQG